MRTTRKSSKHITFKELLFYRYTRRTKSEKAMQCNTCLKEKYKMLSELIFQNAATFSNTSTELPY